MSYLCIMIQLLASIFVGPAQGAIPPEVSIAAADESKTTDSPASAPVSCCAEDDVDDSFDLTSYGGVEVPVQRSQFNIAWELSLDPIQFAQLLERPPR